MSQKTMCWQHGLNLQTQSAEIYTVMSSIMCISLSGIYLLTIEHSVKKPTIQYQIDEDISLCILKHVPVILLRNSNLTLTILSKQNV